MAGQSIRFPFLYLAAYFFFGIGVAGFICILILQPPSEILKGFLYIFLGLILFGTGEIINHPKTPIITPSQQYASATRHFHYKRNACSLGNLFDIGALLLFFIGLSALLFPG
ncbi:MAG: hypothetical protein WBB19_06195 [Desulforhopalus sp.]